MEKLVFDNGVMEFDVNGDGVLRFNPGDPNLYDRFLTAAKKLEAIEAEMVESGKRADENGRAAALRIADGKVKAVLSEVFGGRNDFDAIFGGINIMAVAMNGERVITNFMLAIEPIIRDGAERFATKKIDSAVAEAKAERAARGAE